MLFLLSGYWLSSCIKDYMAVSTFLIGHLLAFFLIWFSSYFNPEPLDATWLLIYFNAGLAVIVCLLFARVWAEYPRYNKDKLAIFP